MGSPKMTAGTRTPQSYLLGEVRNFDGPGHHWGLDWVIFKLLLSHFGSHFGIKNRKNGMSKDDRMKPGSQTPPWDALGSILT